MLIVSSLFTIFVCFGIPIAGLVILARRKKGTGKAFFIGALAFIISQVVIRIPILTYVLPNYAWFSILQMQPWAYGLFLGFTAGLFEEVARWIAIRFFLKGKTDLEHGLSFGLGHGGIEAMLLIGLNLVINLVVVLLGQGALLPASAGSIFVGGLERIYTIAFHVGASLLVMYGIREGKAFRYLVAAIALHTVMDAAIVIMPMVFGIGTLGIEVYGAVISIITLAAGILVYRRGDSKDIL